MLPERWYVLFFPVPSTVHDIQACSISIKLLYHEWKNNCYLVMYDYLWPLGLYSPWNSPGQNTGVGSLSLLQGIFLTQGSNSCVPHCRWILYKLSHKGSHKGSPLWMKPWINFKLAYCWDELRGLWTLFYSLREWRPRGKMAEFFFFSWKSISVWL